MQFWYMELVICAATPFEYAPFKLLYKQFLPKHKISFLHHGIGPAISSALISQQMVKKPKALFIQIGIAGHYKATIGLAKAYLIASDFFGDQGLITPKKRQNLTELGLGNWQPKKLENKDLFINPDITYFKNLTKLPIAKGCTISNITTNASHINYFNQQAIQLETMEGACLHVNGLIHNCKYIQIRGSSNHVGDRNKKNWQINKAIEASNQALIKLINVL
jgi:futalosine hydrolase